MATSKQIKFFNELIAQGREGASYTRMVKGDPQNASIQDMWEAIQELLSSNGNASIPSNDDFNKKMVSEFSKAKKDNFKSELYEQEIDNHINSEYLDEHFENISEEEKDKFTTKLDKTFWILPNGKQLSGDYSNGYRNLDHRQALRNSSSKGIVEAVDNGFVRTIPEYQAIQVKGGDLKNLTIQARKTAQKFLDAGWDIEDVDLRN